MNLDMLQDRGVDDTKVRKLIGEDIDSRSKPLSPDRRRAAETALRGGVLSILAGLPEGYPDDRTREALSRCDLSPGDINRCMRLARMYRATPQEAVEDALPEGGLESVQPPLFADEIAIAGTDKIVPVLPSVHEEAPAVMAPEQKVRKEPVTRAEILSQAGEWEPYMAAILGGNDAHESGEPADKEMTKQLRDMLRDTIASLLTTGHLESDERLTADEAKYVKALVGLRIERTGSGPKVLSLEPKTVHEIRGNAARGRGDSNGAERAIYEGLSKILTKLGLDSSVSAAA